MPKRVGRCKRAFSASRGPARGRSAEDGETFEAGQTTKDGQSEGDDPMQGLTGPDSGADSERKSAPELGTREHDSKANVDGVCGTGEVYFVDVELIALYHLLEHNSPHLSVHSFVGSITSFYETARLESECGVRSIVGSICMFV